MVVASQLRVGMVVKFEGQDYKVVATEYRPGQGRMSGAMHARLRNLETGTFWEHAFRSELKLEELSLDKHTLEFLYADENHCCFMDPENFEQTEIPRELVGVQARFLEAPRVREPVDVRHVDELDGRLRLHARSLPEPEGERAQVSGHDGDQAVEPGVEAMGAVRQGQIDVDLLRVAGRRGGETPVAERSPAAVGPARRPEQVREQLG